MKPQAILYLLWDKNIEVLKAHVERIPGSTILYYSPMGQVSEELIQSVAPYRALNIATLIDTNRDASLRAQLESVKKSTEAYLQSAEWQTYCSTANVPQGALGETIAALGQQYWPDAVRLLHALDAALERFDLRIILLNEDVTNVGRLIAAWARRVGVKTLLMQHSILLGSAYTVHRGLFADVTAVFGTRGADAYLDIGVDPKRIVVTGNPGWDVYRTLPMQRQQVRFDLLKRHQLDPDKPTVVFGTTWAANLTAHCNEKAYEDTLFAFLKALQALMASHPTLQAVIKDRISNESLFQSRFTALLPSFGLTPERVRYVTSDTESWVVAADVLIGVDSNLAVEALLAGTPAINLCNELGMMLGPAFDAESGIVDVEPADLAGAIARLLDDAEWRASRLALGKRARGHYQADTQEPAALRLALLIESLGQFHAKPAGYVWQQYLAVEEIDATGYHGGARGDLVDMFTNQPRLVLDIGCAAGGTGELLKRKYPKCKVWGVETNRAAASIAAKRLDRVLVGMFEEFDLEKEGIAKGSLDGVILADVLEHMYNPWAVMTALHPYLSTTSQIIISIPNVRNLKLMEDMAAGFWRYEPAGLLDITHIRFFTLKEFRRFLHETGFHINYFRYGIDQRLHPFYEAHKHLELQNIELGRMRLADVSKEELSELCSLQFYINASLGALIEDIRPYQVSEPYKEYLQFCRLSKAEARQYDRLIATWDAPPKAAIFIQVAAGQDNGLTATIKNLRQQLYQHLAIWVVSSSNVPDGVQLSDRFQWVVSASGIAGAWPTSVQKCDAEWVGWLNAGDMLEPQAILRMIEASTRHPDWQMIYSDEDAILGEGEFGDPVRKPDFDPQFLMSMPYLGGFCMARRTALLALEAITTGAADATEVDVALRVWQRWGRKAVGHLPAVLYHRERASGPNMAAYVNAAQFAVNAVLGRARLPARVESGWRPGIFRWQYQVSTHDMVSILIPVRDQLPALQRTLEALLSHANYAAFEILLLDNGSTDSATLLFLQGLDALGDPRIKVFRLVERVGLAKLYNLLAAEAQGTYLALMHFDCTPLDPNWLEALIGELHRPGVGVVAPRLLDNQGKVRGGGVILGMDGGYAPAFAGLAHDDPGPWGRAHAAQAFSALTGGALLMRRETYVTLDGLDTSMGAAAEVDFCIRLGERGYQALWTPYVSLMSEGAAWTVDWLSNAQPVDGTHMAMDGATQTLAPLLQRWLSKFAADPSYNVGLTRITTPFAVELRPSLQRPLLEWKPLPRILVHPADNSGCGYYRILQPASALSREGLAETIIGQHLLQVTELARLEVDTVVFQRQIYEAQVRSMRNTRKYANPFMVFEIDDLITNLPSKNLHRDTVPGDTQRWLREAVGLCDRFVVSTEPLAQAMRGYNDDIRVVPNLIDAERWAKLWVPKRDGAKPRVGWAGGISHSGDLEVIADVVKELAGEVDWVFLGMCSDALRPYIAEFYPGVPMDKYPAKLASLGLDLAVAPLEMNPFNEAKSNLKLLEYGVLAYPVICTDIVPYQCGLPVTRVKNRYRDWVNAIREHLADRDASAKQGAQLKQAVLEGWTIERHLDRWLAGWTR